MGTKDEIGDDRIPAEFATVSGYVANSAFSLWTGTTQIDDTLEATTGFLRRNSNVLSRVVKTASLHRVFCRTY
jgi:hypothetical protein